MKAKVRIDLNVRVRGNGTFAGFEDLLEGSLGVGEEVIVVEDESGVSGPARVSEIDLNSQLIYLDVEWAELKRPSPSAPSQSTSRPWAASNGTAEPSPLFLSDLERNLGVRATGVYERLRTNPYTQLFRPQRLAVGPWARRPAQGSWVQLEGTCDRLPRAYSSQVEFAESEQSVIGDKVVAR